MKRRHLPPHQPARSHPLMAFAATVVLAVSATAVVLLPDVAVQAADALAQLPSGLDAMVSSSGILD